MRNEKRTSQRRRRVGSGSALGQENLCSNHLSFNGMFTFAHFSLSIVPEEAELMRKLMGRVSERQAQSQIPTFHTHVWSPDSARKQSDQTSSRLQ